MKIVIALNFAVLALILSGLLLISRANYDSFNQSAKFWTAAVLGNIMGLLLFAAMFMVIEDFSESNFLFGTVANTLMFGALVFQTASIHATRAEITRRKMQWMLAAIVVFAFFWDGFRTYALPNQRMLTFPLIALVLLLWQLYELKKDTSPSYQRTIIFYAVLGEVVFTCVRLIAFSGMQFTIISPEQLPTLAIVAVWIQYGLKIIAYAALVGYWSESLAKKKAQAELEAQAFKALSERQERLIADLGRLNKAATAGVLAASIAHELSQPLQSILLNNTLALDEANKQQPDFPLIQTTLQEQSHNANRMVEVINTLRGVFTETGTVEQQVDLFDLLERLGLLIQPQAKRRGIQVTFEKTGTTIVNVKISEIQQVLLNIVGNAFDALLGSQTNNPMVKITLCNENGWVVCQVEDNGPGIAKEKLDDVFKFLDTTKTTGMGLGLWLSKYIVERNKGNIQVGSSNLGGAKFSISLPAWQGNG